MRGAMLFAVANNTQSSHGPNHWIPFTEEEVGAQDCFASHFMSDFLKGNGAAGVRALPCGRANTPGSPRQMELRTVFADGESACKHGTKIRAFLCGAPVARLTGHEFEGLKGISNLVRAVYDSYSSVKWTACNPTIGTVRLTRNGINDSLHHGYGRAKLAAFAALPQIIASGLIVQETANWKKRGYRSYVLASPIQIGQEAYCAFVVVNQMVNGDQNFYLHEVAKTEELKKSAEGLRAGLSSSGGEVVPSLGDIRSLAFSIFAVNGGAKVLLSDAARAVLGAGRELWRYYHKQPKANPNASYYDIRKFLVLSQSWGWNSCLKLAA